MDRIHCISKVFLTICFSSGFSCDDCGAQPSQWYDGHRPVTGLRGELLKTIFSSIPLFKSFKDILIFLPPCWCQLAQRKWGIKVSGGDVYSPTPCPHTSGFYIFIQSPYIWILYFHTNNKKLLYFYNFFIQLYLEVTFLPFPATSDFF